MYYNKLYGLKFLEKAFKGVRGVHVLPCRVYRSPEEFDNRHFRSPERLLFRSNLDGSMAQAVWSSLPRRELDFNRFRAESAEISKEFPAKTPRNVLEDMSVSWNLLLFNRGKGFADLLKRYSTDPSSFHFLVHKVLSREKYFANGSLTVSSDGNVTVCLSRTGTQPYNWRVHSSTVVMLKNLREGLKKVGLVGKNHAQIFRQLTSVAKLMARKAKRMHELKNDVLEASFTIRRFGPRTLEFYDCLRLPGNYVPLNAPTR